MDKKRAASALFTVLATLAHAQKAKAQGHALQEPLYPRLDASTAKYGEPTTLTFLVHKSGEKGKPAGGEQEVFLPLGSVTGHLFVGVGPDGKPTYAHVGGAFPLHRAIRGGLTVLAPVGARHAFSPGLQAKLERQGVTLKFVPTIDTGGKRSYNGVVVKGLNMGPLQAALRLGGDNDQSVDLSAAVRWGPIGLEAGGRTAKGGRKMDSIRERVTFGRKGWYASLGTETNWRNSPLVTVSLGREWGRGIRPARRK